MCLMFTFIYLKEDEVDEVTGNVAEHVCEDLLGMDPWLRHGHHLVEERHELLLQGVASTAAGSHVLPLLLQPEHVGDQLLAVGLGQQVAHQVRLWPGQVPGVGEDPLVGHRALQKEL